MNDILKAFEKHAEESGLNENYPDGHCLGCDEVRAGEKVGFTAGYKQSRIDLPKCDTCSYYEKANDIETYWHDCSNPKVDIKEYNFDEGFAEDVTPRVTRDFGCIYHSELDTELNKENKSDG